MCSFDSHKCWPGRCSTSLTKDCVCAEGFRLEKSTSHTSCQLSLNNTPTIINCRIQLREGVGGKARQSPSGECKLQKDFFGNFQPRIVQFEMGAVFKIDISNITRPLFISESKFGVTDANVYLQQKPISGVSRPVDSYSFKYDQNASVNATETFFGKANVSENTTHLQNGERLCVRFEAKGGGYVIAHDFANNRNKSPQAYDKTVVQNVICYRYDSMSPKHCTETNV
ncbi:uncharacterized protein LOC128223568 [Mya arenaria]|uniref:uncharacterized protein LOC128223568 n=1 Tax=Mya arenaria TaxID=6604 RepID=UPI0022E8B701|nr:uncharacterized protein LOC128223568 [Mya arenaria]